MVIGEMESYSNIIRINLLLRGFMMNNTITKTKKDFGPGSLTILISIFSIMFANTYLNRSSVAIGGQILNKLNIYHMENLVSYILAVVSLCVANKYKDNWGAKAGRGIAIFYLSLSIILLITSSLSRV
jgi:O-antigen ligase